LSVFNKRKESAGREKRKVFGGLAVLTRLPQTLIKE